MKPSRTGITPTVVLAGLIVLAGTAGTATAVRKIGTRALRNRAVTTAKLRDAAVTGPKLAEGAVTGPKVRDGSLGLEEVATAIVPASFSPPFLGPGACFTQDVSVPGMQETDLVLVLPGTAADGWPPRLLLDGYGPLGPASAWIRICAVGSSVDVDAVPFTVLVFR